MYVNHLGNQALMRASENSGLRSNAFSQKKEIYKVSPYVLTQQITEESDWTDSAIIERQKKLVSCHTLRVGYRRLSLVRASGLVNCQSIREGSHPTIINLEHILPKKPQEHWPQFTGDEVKMYVNHLGNQALMRASENSGLRSNAFSQKKEIYKVSPYVLTQQITEASDWTDSAIIERQKKLAKLALIAWPV